MDQLPVQVLNAAAAAMKGALRGLPLLAALCACEQIIEPDLPEHTPRLVLQAFFTADSAWTAYLTRSAGIRESLPSSRRPVADAAVELLEGDRVIGQLRWEREGTYVLDDNPLEAGRPYSLRVSAPGFAAIRATDTIPRPVPVRVASRVAASARSDGAEYAIEVEIQDPPGETNYYQISLYFGWEGGRQELYFSTKDPSITADNGVEGGPFEAETFEGEAPYFKDTLFDGRAHEIELTAPLGAVSGRGGRYLQILRISETYYEYLRTARLHDETRDNPFAEPLGVLGNVEDGYGVFAGYSSSTFEIAVE